MGAAQHGNRRTMKKILIIIYMIMVSEKTQYGIVSVVGLCKLTTLEHAPGNKGIHYIAQVLTSREDQVLLLSDSL